MIRIKLAVVAVVALMLVASSAFAAQWNGLTVDGSYSDVSISDHYLGPYLGTVSQAGVASAYVYYCLPQIVSSVSGSQPMYGVCIDTKQFTGSPQQLRQGWDGVEFNGTVVNQAAWNHTTYLFAQHQNELSAWWNTDTVANRQNAAAFQLAIWEVMSGDGSTGANWGSGNFSATDVTNANGLLPLANSFVAQAFTGFETNWSPEKANEAYYMHDHQDFLVYAPGTPVVGSSPVPEPMSLILGFMGLSSVAGFRRLRRK